MRAWIAAHEACGYNNFVRYHARILRRDVCGCVPLVVYHAGTHFGHLRESMSLDSLPIKYHWLDHMRVCLVKAP